VKDGHTGRIPFAGLTSLGWLDQAPLVALRIEEDLEGPGLTHHRLYSVREPGALEQVGRGIYRKADANFTDLDLLGVAKRAPEATVCLLSALARHDLTDAIPASPGHRAALRQMASTVVGSRPMAHFRGSDVRHRADDRPGRRNNLRLCNAPKTIVDTCRVRNTAGSEIAHEALRRWPRGGGQTTCSFQSHWPVYSKHRCNNGGLNLAAGPPTTTRPFKACCPVAR